MPIAAPNAGDRILNTDLGAFYNLLKGVAGSGESLTLVYNAAHSLIFQPSSDPAAGTEVLAIKNNAGTVQGSLTYDGKIKVADGTAALPSIRLQSEATGFYRSSAGVIGVSVSGAAANILLSASSIAIGANPATPGAYTIALATASTVVARNAANNGDVAMIQTDASNRVIVGDGNQTTYLQSSAGNIDIRYATTALGGGAAPTFGTIGGSGPATAGQNSWLKVAINGTASFIPIWR